MVVESAAAEVMTVMVNVKVTEEVNTAMVATKLMIMMIKTVVKVAMTTVVVTGQPHSDSTEIF